MALIGLMVSFDSPHTRSHSARSLCPEDLKLERGIERTLSAQTDAGWLHNLQISTLRSSSRSHVIRIRFMTQNMLQTGARSERRPALRRERPLTICYQIGLACIGLYGESLYKEFSYCSQSWISVMVTRLRWSTLPYFWSFSLLVLLDVYLTTVQCLVKTSASKNICVCLTGSQHHSDDWTVMSTIPYRYFTFLIMLFMLLHPCASVLHICIGLAATLLLTWLLIPELIGKLLVLHKELLTQKDIKLPSP